MYPMFHAIEIRVLKTGADVFYKIMRYDKNKRRVTSFKVSLEDCLGIVKESLVEMPPQFIRVGPKLPLSLSD